MPTEKPHRPEPLSSHDPYPTAPDRDPMAERRRNSGAFYDDVDALTAARPARPTYITHTEGTDAAGYVITYDDGLGTVIKVEPTDRIGVTVLEVTSLGDTVRVELGAFTVNVLDKVLRDLAGLTPDNAAPITGSR